MIKNRVYKLSITFWIMKTLISIWCQRILTLELMLIKPPWLLVACKIQIIVLEKEGHIQSLVMLHNKIQSRLLCLMDLIWINNNWGQMEVISLKFKIQLCIPVVHLNNCYHQLMVTNWIRCQIRHWVQKIHKILIIFIKIKEVFLEVQVYQIM